MAVVSKQLTGNLRVISDFTDEAIGSYHQIRHSIQAPQVESFVEGLTLLRGETDGNAYLTLTTALSEGGD